jgi:hypothetical protein
MKPEILWNYDKTRDFLEDLKSFAKSLDFWQINCDLERVDDTCYVYVKNGDYEFSFEPKEAAFQCPNCNEVKFSVLEGELKNNPAIGLACLNCETYGAVFPNGL